MKLKLATIRPRSVLLWTILGYIIIFSILSLWKLSHFQYDNLDLAIFNQVFWNTLHGNIFAATIHPPTYLQDHFTPIIFLLMPLYAIRPGPHILLILQTIIIGLTAIPIHAIAKHVLKNYDPLLALFPPLIWLVNPLTHNMNFFEFHVLPFGVFLVFLTLYAYLKEKKFAFILFFILALFTREDMALILVFFSLISFIHKRNYFWKISPLVISVVYTITAFMIIEIHSPTQSYKFTGYYGWLGGDSLTSIALGFLTHPVDVLLHMASVGNIEMILGFTFPFFFTVFTASAYATLLIAPLSQIMLSSQGGSAIIVMTHYAGYFLIGLIMLFIDRLKKTELDIWPRSIPKIFRQKKYLYSIVAVATVYSTFTYGAITPTVTTWNDQNHKDEKNYIFHELPDDAAVGTTFEFLTPASSRRYLYSLHYAYLGKNQYALQDYILPENTEYLLIDWLDMLIAHIHFVQDDRYANQLSTLHVRWRNILSHYSVLDQRGGSMLMKKNSEQDEPTIARIYVDDSLQEVSRPRIFKTAIENDMLSISTALPREKKENNQYYIEIARDLDSFILPLGYLLYPQETWDGNNALEMTLRFDPDNPPRSLQLFKWTNGSTKLSELKNIYYETDAKAIGEAIIIPDTL